MKKILMMPALAIFLLTAGCGSGDSGLSGNTPGTTAVTINFGNTDAAANAGAVSATSTIPSAVVSIRITVSADDMVTVEEVVPVAGESSVSVTLDILNGPDRHIVLEAMTSSGVVLYRGETWLDLNGKSLTITIDLAATSSCRLYVDVNAGADDSDCSNPDTPCKTITYALTQTDGNEEICIDAGTYDSAAGETFPIALKQGASLNCRGDNHTTIITNSSTTDTIVGAPSASVEGCKISVTNVVSAIDDNGAVITVNDCFIDGGSDINGIYLSAGSTVSNSTITKFKVGEVGGTGIIVSSGSPSITGNTITGNSYGISILSGGTPTINNNVLSCNTIVDLLNNTTGSTINARSNRWDNSTPSEVSGTCNLGEDICNSNFGSVDYTGSTQAASPCP